MSKTYSELIIEGRFTLVKGFLVGFICGVEPEAKYFFHQKSNIIKRDTLMGLVKELFEVEDYVYLCLEDNVVERFKNAVEIATPKIGISIKEIKKIKDAEFKFSFAIFNEENAKECKNIFSNLPEGINLIDFSPVEKVDKDAPVISYRKERHPYSYKGSGIVRGDFGNMVELFLKCKRSVFSQFVECEEIMLNFE
jgi:hypothetical protein